MRSYDRWITKKIIWQNINSSKEKGKILTGKIIAIENEQMKEEMEQKYNEMKEEYNNR